FTARKAQTLSATGRLVRRFRETGSLDCWITFATAITHGSRQRSRRRKRGERTYTRGRALLSSREPTPGISARTFPASRARCWFSQLGYRHTWQNARKAPNEGTRDTRSAEFRLSSSPWSPFCGPQ